LSLPEAKFKINVKEGVVELEGNENFVDKHLDKFEEIFKVAIREAITPELGYNSSSTNASSSLLSPTIQKGYDDTQSLQLIKKHNNSKHTIKQSGSLSPVPVDLKANEDKLGLREFYSEKKPVSHYEKAVVFVYYLTKFNKQTQIKYGEILSCYEEVEEKKPSINDIVKNSMRYKGWLEQGSDKLTTRLTISGENFVKFDLPKKRNG
jgi:hypothetical protein